MRVSFLAILTAISLAAIDAPSDERRAGFENDSTDDREWYRNGRGIHGASAANRWPETALTFRRLSSADGLPHNTIHTIMQDRRGFIWIGTADGLARYDGYEFEVYRSISGDTSSLAHNTIRATLEDTDGSIWIGTERGVDRLDRRSGLMERIGWLTDDRSAVWDFAKDTTGRLWIASPRELVALDVDRGSIAHFQAPRTDSIVEAFGRLDVDPEGTVWVGQWTTSEGTVYRVNAETGALEAFTSDVRLSPGFYLHAGASGSIWLGSPNGVFCLDAATKSIVQIPGLPPSDLLLEDSHGRLWASGPSGLFLYDARVKEATRVRLDPTGSNALSQSIRVLFEDRTGIIWIGTLSGIYRHVPHAPSFGLLQHSVGNSNGLSSNVVSAFLEEEDALWIGTLGGGLNRVNRWDGEFAHYRKARESSLPPARRDAVDEREGTFPSDNVWAIHRDQSGRLWIGTDAGLCHLNHIERSCTLVDLDSHPPYVNVLAEDADGALWIGGDEVLRVEPQSWTVDRIELIDRHFTDSPGTVHNVQALHFDAEGILWIGTEFSGLIRYDPDSGHQHHYPFGEDGEHALLGRSVRAIVSDPTQPNVRWLGTEMGLIRFDVETEQFQSVWPRHADASGNAYAILSDTLERLWVSTSRGILRISPDRSRIRRYGPSDGTGSVEFNRRASHRGRDGLLYFGGMDGVTSFDPTTLRLDLPAAPLAITSVVVASRDTTRRIHRHGSEPVVLGPDDNTLTLKYAALDFANAARTRYVYRLDGFDKRWISAGHGRTASYTNLPAGQYTFRVQAEAANVVNESAALAIVVRPPFSQTWWFRLLILTAVGSVLLAAHRFRVLQLLRIERMRMRIAGDLHDEIGSKLSSIALRSEMVARDTVLASDAQRQLQEISRTSRRMVNELRDIVWMVNPRFDTVEDLISKIDHTAASLLGDRSYRLHVNGNPPQPLELDIRRHLYLMCREMLYNVVRHAGASHVDIHITSSRSAFEISVSDDGSGFDPTADFAGNGLELLRARARAIDGRLEVWSRPGEGARCRIRVEHS